MFSLVPEIPRGMGVGEIHPKIGGEGDVPAISVSWSQASNLRRCAGRFLTAPERASLTESASWPGGRATGHRYRLAPSHQGAYRRLPALPMTKAPSQWQGTWRLVTSAGPALDGARADDLRAGGLLAAAWFPLLAAGAQANPGTLRLSFRVGVDPGVNGLV